MGYKTNRMFFDKNLVSLLKMMDKNGFITRRSQGLYKSTLGYYLVIRYLKERELISYNGLNNRNMKKWSLTNKGKYVLRRVEEIEEQI